MKRRQQGITLISMMIGLAISLGVILTMLSLFQSLIVISLKSNQDAAQDGEVSTGLTTLQSMVQSAGYGLEADVTPHIELATTNVAQESTSLLWRYADGGAIRCEGVVELASVDARTKKDMRVLTLLTANPCSETAKLGSLTWTASSTLSRFKNTSSQQTRLTLEQQDCTPFGVSALKAQHYVVGMHAPSSAVTAGVAGVEPIHYSVCLTNLTPG